MTAAVLVLELLTLKDAADRLNISTKLLRREVRARRLRFILVGKRRRFTVEDLAEYIAKQRQETPCPSSSPRVRHTGISTSGSGVYDITARLASRTGRRQRG